MEEQPPRPRPLELRRARVGDRLLECRRRAVAACPPIGVDAQAVAAEVVLQQIGGEQSRVWEPIGLSSQRGERARREPERLVVTDQVQKPLGPDRSERSARDVRGTPAGRDEGVRPADLDPRRLATELHLDRLEESWDARTTLEIARATTAAERRPDQRSRAGPACPAPRGAWPGGASLDRPRPGRADRLRSRSRLIRSGAWSATASRRGRRCWARSRRSGSPGTRTRGLGWSTSGGRASNRVVCCGRSRADAPSSRRHANA